MSHLKLCWLFQLCWCLQCLIVVTFCKVSIYIKDIHVERHTGMRQRIWIMQENEIFISFKHDSVRMSKLYVLPYEVTLINLTWLSTTRDPQTYWYNFDTLKSARASVLYDPLLSIPTEGNITKNESEFQLAIPCTGKHKGVVEFEIKLFIGAWSKTSTGDLKQNNLPDFPFNVKIRKNCSKLADQLETLNKEGAQLNKLCRLCRHERKNHGCDNNRFCTCRKIRSICSKRPRCKKPCQNGATCEGKKCLCTSGYYGRHCQRAEQNVWTIFNGCPKCMYGTCMRRNKNNSRFKCVCHIGYRGKNCDKQVNFNYGPSYSVYNIQNPST